MTMMPMTTQRVRLLMTLGTAEPREVPTTIAITLEWMTTAVLAILLLAAAGYAQYRIPFHTAGAARIALARGVLIAVGIAFGYVGASAAGAQGALALLLFLVGFGLVHAPAAIILYIKRARGTGKS